MSKGLIIPPKIDEKFFLFFTTKSFIYKPLEFIKDTFNRDFLLYMPVQKHTDLVIDVDINTTKKEIVADAVITKEVGLFVGVKTADCVPILIIDEVKSVVSAIHAGWRGIAQSILSNTVKKMINKYDCKISNLKAFIGPGIKMCCYAVKEDVFLKIKNSSGDGNYFIENGGSYFVDLQKANREQLLNLGIKDIWIAEYCTCCNQDDFHSYRRDKDKALRQYAIVGIKR
ncbi:MAG TPA: peptidoglycan editing factor PgeF [Nitrospirae bacterium]|nr:peptidoglycan editing factor PgeF [Nitrospirota bacterium]